jgi:hypothetical protein
MGRAQQALFAVAGILGNLTDPTCFRGLPRLAKINASGGGRVDRSGWDVQNRSQSVENFRECSIQITVAEPACAGLIRLRSRPRPPRGCRAQLNTMAPALAAAALGSFLCCGLKKLPAPNGLAFPMQRSLGAAARERGDAMLARHAR